MPPMNFYWVVVVISQGRPERVGKMHKALGPVAAKLEWWVPDEDRDSYINIEHGATLTPALDSDSTASALRGNKAMDRGQTLKKPTVLLADDIQAWTSIQAAQSSWPPGGPPGHPITALMHSDLYCLRCRLGLHVREWILLCSNTKDSYR